jgi:D-glycero-D-manno-heptose 1,7-bisphosphate phosphatase
MKKAIFLDRDGVINELVLNHETGEYEPPHSPDDLHLFPWVVECLKSFQASGFQLFIVSNQPDHAKGKTTLENLQAVQNKLDEILRSEKIAISGYFYCYHHPRGMVPRYSFECECRKPKPFFLLKAARDNDLDLIRSWMIGDRDTDVECGKRAGTRTIQVEEPHSAQSRGNSHPDYITANLKGALQIILSEESNISLE